MSHVHEVTQPQYNEIVRLLDEARYFETTARIESMSLADKVERLRRAKALRAEAMAIGR